MTARARILAAPGARTGPGTGTRAALAAAVAVVRGDPGLWLLGALGFAARGGLLLLVMPIVWVPTPVLLSVFLGGFITTSGVSSSATSLLLAVGLILGLVLIAAVLLAAYADMASFDRTAWSDETAALRADRPALVLGPGERRRLVLRLAGANLLGLVPIGVLMVALGGRIFDVVVQELQYPSSVDTPFMITVLGRVSGELLLLGVVALAMDVLVTLVGRRLLAAAFGFRPPQVRHRARRPLVASAAGALSRSGRLGFIAALCWAVTVVAVVPVLVGTILAWEFLRAVLFQVGAAPATDTWTPLLAQVFATLLFGGVWIAGITVVGLASSVRQALWSTNALH
jgi:hypothetical protein